MRRFLLILPLAASVARASATPVDISTLPLSSLALSSAPWLAMEAGSEQHPPFYVGLHPLALARGAAPEPRVALPARLRALGDEQVAALRGALPRRRVELEGWPSPDDYGLPTWTFARWRPGPEEAWRWLDAASLSSAAVNAPLLPVEKRTWIAEDETAVFEDFLKLPELVDKPMFGDCVWTDEGGTRADGAWRPAIEREAWRTETAARLKDGQRRLCHATPQPARWNGRPLVMVLPVDNSGEAPRIEWPKEMRWVEDRKEAAMLKEIAPPSSPSHFIDTYREDVLALAGEAEAVFPASGRKLRFSRKNSSDPKNQLEDVADYLAERYRTLGLRVERQRFTWRGIPQSNVIAIIPGRRRGADNKPVLLADHFDTAYCEDIYEKEQRRVSAPGADDNATGTAALLAAAARLKDARPENDIWLVHLTGEEYPGDDLGARRFIEKLLGERREIAGLVLLDMIGHRNPGDGVFQENPGASPGSEELARLAVELSSGAVAPGMTPVLRRFDDERSYLYNTDGLLFAEAGYPVVLLNEHINRHENYGRPGHHRPGYHRSDDVSSGVDFEYAASIAELAIRLVERLAGA